MELENKKNHYYLQQAEIFKSLSSPVRLQLVNYISFCPRTVEDCANKIGQSIQNTSLHLASLAKVGVLEVEKIKNYRFYSLTDTESVAQMRKLLRAYDGALLPAELVWKESFSDLAVNIKKKNIFLVDLRSSDEKAHIQLNTPYSFDDSLSKLTEFLQGHFTKQDDIVFTCKGRMCERLTEAVLTAKKARYNVKAAILDAEELSELGKIIL